MTLRFRSLALFAMLTVSLAACRKQAEPAPTPVAPPTTVSNPTPPPQPPAPPATDPDADRRALEAEVTAMRNTMAERIYFDYDRSDLRDDARAVLEAKIPILVGNQQVRIRIEGHTDSRGSDAYNMALGQRRAAAAKQYLESRGIAGSRIDIISYGKERPAAMGENESAWAQNRRDEFVIIAGGESLRPVQR